MKTLTLGELPADLYFWRKGFPYKWLKLHNQLISPVAEVPKELEFVRNPDLREIVLSDPRWCAECGVESGKSPTGPCPKCGSTSTPAAFEDVKKIIEDWIGYANPHI